MEHQLHPDHRRFISHTVLKTTKRPRRRKMGDASQAVGIPPWSAISLIVRRAIAPIAHPRRESQPIHRRPKIRYRDISEVGRTEEPGNSRMNRGHYRGKNEPGRLRPRQEAFCCADYTRRVSSP